MQVPSTRSPACARSATRRPTPRRSCSRSAWRTSGSSQAFEAGAQTVLSKAVHPVALGTLLREVVARQRRAAPPRRARRGPRPQDCPLTRARARDPRASPPRATPTARSPAELWVTEQTVKFHLSNIYRKLGVANRTEASRYAYVNDLMEPMSSLPPEQPRAAVRAAGRRRAAGRGRLRRRPRGGGRRLLRGRVRPLMVADVLALVTARRWSPTRSPKPSPRRRSIAPATGRSRLLAPAAVVIGSALFAAYRPLRAPDARDRARQPSTRSARSSTRCSPARSSGCSSRPGALAASTGCAVFTPVEAVLFLAAALVLVAVAALAPCAPGSCPRSSSRGAR